MSNPLRACVVDASVGIKLCIAEPGSDLADALFALAGASPGIRLLVPDLFYIECASVLRKHVRHSGYAPDQAQRDLDQMMLLRLQRTPTADLAKDALELALAHAISAYDACYVALARREGIPLVTADEELARKLAGTTHDIRLLRDITLAPSP